MAKIIKADQIDVEYFYDNSKPVVIRDIPITTKHKTTKGELYLCPQDDELILYCNGCQEPLPVCFDGPDSISANSTKISGKLSIELILPIIANKDIDKTVRAYFEPIMRDMVRVLLWFCMPYIDENGKLAVAEIIISRDNSPYSQRITKIKPTINKRKITL